MSNQTFLDIRSHGFARVAVVIPRVHLADPLKNLRAHQDLLTEAFGAGAEYAVCPELGLTGYSCSDLFHSQTLVREAEGMLGKLIKASSSLWPGMLVSVGLPVMSGDALFNSAATFGNGSLLAVAPKSYPPEYREFYEGRHFARASEALSDRITVAGHTVPFGADILIGMSGRPDFVLHTEVCEDLWVPVPPSTRAALAGATVLANLSASNITIGKAEYREELVKGSSARNLAVQLYSAAGFGESTTDLAWDGDAYIAERGAVLKKAERFPREGAMIMADVDLASLKQDRMRQSSYRQNASDLRMPFRTVTFYPRNVGGQRNADVHKTFMRGIDPLPFVPSDPAKRDVRCRETFMIQSTSLERRIDGLSHKKVVLAFSGGRDSTLALLVAVHAMDRAGLPRKDIDCLTMPGFGTSEGTRAAAIALMEGLGVTWREVDIKDLATLTFEKIGYVPEANYDAEKNRYSLTYENVQAWTRTFLIFAESCEKGLVLGTGDLTEMLLGYCTYAADHMSHYGINAGVPKTLISFLIKWSSDVVFKDESEVRAALDAILALEISAELQPLDKDGKIAQKSEVINGPYEVHDFFGYWFVRFGFPPAKIVRMALHAFDGKYDVGQLKGWMAHFLKSFFRNQFKRSCMPDGPKVGLVAVSPRGDWRMPSDARANAWLRDLEKIPDAF